jgi:hypothetical protein
MEAGRPRMDMAARPIEEGRTMTQKEYTVTIHGNRMWRGRCWMCQRKI